jgi:hypothetical protein
MPHNSFDTSADAHTAKGITGALLSVLGPKSQCGATTPAGHTHPHSLSTARATSKPQHCQRRPMQTPIADMGEEVGGVCRTDMRAPTNVAM